MALKSLLKKYQDVFPNFKFSIVEVSCNTIIILVVYSPFEFKSRYKQRSKEIKLKTKKIKDDRYVTRKMGDVFDNLSNVEKWLFQHNSSVKINIPHKSLTDSICFTKTQAKYLLRNINLLSICEPDVSCKIATIGKPKIRVLSETMSEEIIPFVPRIGAEHSSIQTSLGIPSNIIVFVVDTGIQGDHPALNVNSSLSKNFTSDDSTDWGDENGHGTHVAGIIGAVQNSDIGMSGVATGVSVVSVRVLDRNGGGDLDLLIAGLDYIESYIVSNPSSKVIVNMSLGFEGINKIINTAVNNLTKRAIVCTAAGNFGMNANLFTPAGSIASTVTVGAYNILANKLARFSNYGSVDILAPGVNIYSTYIGSTYAILNGTSMAAPMVAGTFVALATSSPDIFFTDLPNVLISRSKLIKQTNFDTTKGTNKRIKLTSIAKAAKTTNVSVYTGSS